jgi:hypothetical protein
MSNSQAVHIIHAICGTIHNNDIRGLKQLKQAIVTTPVVSRVHEDALETVINGNWLDDLPKKEVRSFGDAGVASASRISN